MFAEFSAPAPAVIVVAIVAASVATSGAALAAPPASDDGSVPAQLSLPQAEQIFLERGLDLLIAQYGAQGAEGDLKAAGAHPNPGVDLSVLYTPANVHSAIYSNLQQNSTTKSLWGFSVGVTDNAAIEDILSGKHALRIEAASKALAAAQLNVADVKRLELGELRQAYAAAVMAELNVKAAKDSLATFDAQLALNQKRYDEGAINGLDLSRAKQAELESLQAVDAAESGRKQALASLLFLLGVRGAAPGVTLTSGIGYALLARLSDPNVASLHALALENRTDVKIAVANAEQAEAQLRSAKRARVPDVALSLGYSEQCSGDACSSLPAFSAGVQGNVPLFYQQQGEIKRAQSNAAAAQRSLDKVKAQVLSDVTQALAGYTAAKSQVERMEGQLLEQAKVSRDLAQHMYQKGAASFIDFMDAQRQYVASRLEYNQDLASYWNAVYELERVTGAGLR